MPNAPAAQAVNPAQRRKQQRLQMKRRRQALGQREQRSAARNLAQQFINSPFGLRYGRIGSYLAGNGELDPVLIHRHLWARQQTLAVPTVRGANLEFYALQPRTRLVRNRFDLSEPAAGTGFVDTRSFSLLLMPLVAFDNRGNRIGMGGGFYDRHLARLPESMRPLLVGVGHDFQEVAQVPTQPWDIALDGLLTPSRWLRFTASATKHTRGIR